MPTSLALGGNAHIAHILGVATRRGSAHPSPKAATPTLLTKVGRRARREPKGAPPTLL